MSVYKYGKGVMAKKMKVIFFVLVMLQLPAHSDTTIQIHVLTIFCGN